GIQIGGQFAGGFNGNLGGVGNPYQGQQGQRGGEEGRKLTYDELQRRRQEQREGKEKAKKAGKAITGLNFREGIEAVTSADEMGDYYQYQVIQSVSLSRQRSAMLPILAAAVEGTKVSIFNESVHPKYPLLGLRLKNTAGQPLPQGPVTVYDDQ